MIFCSCCTPRGLAFPCVTQAGTQAALAASRARCPPGGERTLQYCNPTTRGQRCPEVGELEGFDQIHQYLPLSRCLLFCGLSPCPWVSVKDFHFQEALTPVSFLLISLIVSSPIHCLRALLFTAGGCPRTSGCPLPQCGGTMDPQQTFCRGDWDPGYIHFPGLL